MFVLYIIASVFIFLYLRGIHLRDQAVVRAVTQRNEATSKKRSTLIDLLIGFSVAIQAVLAYAMYWSSETVEYIGSSAYVIASPAELSAVAQVGHTSLISAVLLMIVSSLLVGRLIAQGTKEADALLTGENTPDYIPEDIINEHVSDASEEMATA